MQLQRGAGTTQWHPPAARLRPADDADARLQVDATASAEVEACVKQVVAEFGRVDGAANCVGK